MRYLSGGAREEGCVFCNRLDGANDVESLILHRAEHCFVIMNLYPYGSGHVMIVPNHHAADPVGLDQQTRHEMADMLPLLTAILRSALACQGFNSGFNFGEAGGAGIAEHLHQHIVPRWIGDANFMPIIASTKVMPETLPVSYAKIRAELERAISSRIQCKVIALVNDDQSIVLDRGALPIADGGPDVPLWRSAVTAVHHVVDQIEVAGWAGSTLARSSGMIALTLRGRFKGQGSRKVIAIERALEMVSEPDRLVIEHGLKHLAPR